MAVNFSSVTPTLVVPQEPEYHTVITQAESQKKNFMNFSGSTPVYSYKLKWTRITDEQCATILTHFHSTYGGYDSFYWTCVPSYIDSDHDGIADGGNLFGRWVNGSFKRTPNAYSWDVSLGFEEEVD